MSANDVTRVGVTPVVLVPTPALGWLLARRAALLHLATFGAVGAVCFLVDLGVYNLLRLTVLAEQPIGAKVASVAVATLVAWMGNRLLTFHDRRGHALLREGVLFAAANVLGLVVAALCLFVSHYLLGFQSRLADNISGNGIGLLLGTSVRYLAYRLIVFRPPSSRSLELLP